MTFDELCAEHRLTQRERLELWAHLCLLRYRKAMERIWEHDRAVHAATAKSRRGRD